MVLERDGKKEFETTARMYTANPFWNEVYTYHTTDHCLPEFRIKVYDRDVLSDTCIGEVRWTCTCCSVFDASSLIWRLHVH